MQLLLDSCIIGYYLSKNSKYKKLRYLVDRSDNYLSVITQGEMAFLKRDKRYSSIIDDFLSNNIKDIINYTKDDAEYTNKLTYLGDEYATEWLLQGSGKRRGCLYLSEYLFNSEINKAPIVLDNIKEPYIIKSSRKRFLDVFSIKDDLIDIIPYILKQYGKVAVDAVQYTYLLYLLKINNLESYRDYLVQEAVDIDASVSDIFVEHYNKYDLHQYQLWTASSVIARSHHILLTLDKKFYDDFKSKIKMELIKHVKDETPA
ncbi:MAG: hypothetical protein LBL45_08545 [Treponema sp.]|jgi:hypothetical protein|nr:hypothetical protein [Treponema sp.]